ncbi:unnamed protein product, partial [Callosobruchus maculatus]
MSIIHQKQILKKVIYADSGISDMFDKNIQQHKTVILSVLFIKIISNMNINVVPK